MKLGRLFLLVLSLSESAFAANVPAVSGGSTVVVSAAQIPRLPSLEELQKIVGAGAPTQRLRDLPKYDETSACEILLRDSAAGLSFANVMNALQKAGITAKNLTDEERSFLLAATALHIANKMQEGNTRDLEGVDRLFTLLEVHEFKFSDEYLAVIKFWLETMPGASFEATASVRHDDYDGELDFS